MNLLEVKSLFETSVRCLAISMQEAMKRQLMMVEDGDFAMNDHLVFSLPQMELHDESDVEKCLESLKSMYRGLQDVEDFYMWDNANFSYLDWEAPQIATLMMGFVAGFKNENLPPCAIEVQNLSRELLRSASGKPNDVEFRNLRDEFISRLKAITDKYGIDLGWEEKYSLPLGYLNDWFKSKYWN